MIGLSKVWMGTVYNFVRWGAELSEWGRFIASLGNRLSRQRAIVLLPSLIHFTAIIGRFSYAEAARLTGRKA
jgi:hypothetical protein